MRTRLNFVFILLFLLSLVNVSVARARPAASPAFRFSLADLGEEDLVVQSIYDNHFIDFTLAEGRQITRATLQLHLSHSEKLLPQESDLLIALNDEPAANIILGPENAAESVIDIELPVDALRPGQNEILFRFNLRLVENGCGDVNSPDLWLKLFADTSIVLEADDAPVAANLGLYPAPFSTLSNLPGNPQLSVILPPHPTAAELTAATQVLAALGQAAQWVDPPVWAFTADQLDQARLASDQLIVIDRDGRNPLVKGSSPGISAQASPYNPNRLMMVISGPDDATLLESAALLANRAAFGQFSGALVSPKPVQPAPAPVRPTRATFAELGFDSKRVRGIGLHDLYYPINVPFDWKTTSEASIELHFAHGDAISAASLLTVYINGFEVSNVRLSDSNARDGRLVIQLSPRQIHIGRNWLHLVFDLHMPQENCKYRYLEEAWAEIPADRSLLNLAHVTSEAPMLLDYLPSHSVTPADLSKNLFIVPAVPASPELTAMLRIAAKLGSYSQANGLMPQAITADLFDTQTRAFAGLDVLAFGTPENNEFLARYDQNLPQPLRLENGSIVPVSGHEMLPEELDGQAAYLQVLPAPWSPRNAVVVFSAPGPDLLYRVVDLFPAIGRRSRLEGNVAVVSATRFTDFNFGSFDAGASLSPAIRLFILVFAIGTVLVLALTGLYLNRQRRLKELEKAHKNDE